MTYEINGGETPPINFAPATIAEEVMQNVRMIISTIKYSVPMDREFGIDAQSISQRRIYQTRYFERCAAMSHARSLNPSNLTAMRAGN